MVGWLVACLLACVSGFISCCCFLIVVCYVVVVVVLLLSLLIFFFIKCVCVRVRACVCKRARECVCVSVCVNIHWSGSRAWLDATGSHYFILSRFFFFFSFFFFVFFFRKHLLKHFLFCMSINIKHLEMCNCCQKPKRCVPMPKPDRTDKLHGSQATSQNAFVPKKKFFFFFFLLSCCLRLKAKNWWCFVIHVTH